MMIPYINIIAHITVAFSLFFLLPCVTHAQGSDSVAILRLDYSTGNESLNHLMRFENLAIQLVHFKSTSLKGTFYQLFVKEFKRGKLVKTDTLIDGTIDDFFMIKKDSSSFRFICKIQDDKLRMQISTPQFSSRKLTYALLPIKEDYALKDFLGANTTLAVPIGKPFYLCAIIPPTIYPDGSGSYCNVAQSDVPPEEFGPKFRLEQYFLVEMVITKSILR